MSDIFPILKYFVTCIPEEKVGKKVSGRLIFNRLATHWELFTSFQRYKLPCPCDIWDVNILFIVCHWLSFKGRVKIFVYYHVQRSNCLFRKLCAIGKLQCWTPRITLFNLQTSSQNRTSLYVEDYLYQKGFEVLPLLKRKRQFINFKQFGNLQHLCAFSGINLKLWEKYGIKTFCISYYIQAHGSYILNLGLV